MYTRLCFVLCLLIFTGSAFTAAPVLSYDSASAEAALSGGPLTASDCVKLALERNFSVLNAREGVKEAHGQELSAISPLVPYVESSAGVSHRIQGPREYYIPDFDLTLKTDKVTSDSYTYSIQATQSLLNVSDWARFFSARSSFRASRHSFEATRQSVAYQVKTQFYELLKAVKLAEVGRTALELSQDELRRAKALFEVGSVARGDVLKAEVRLSQSMLDLISAENRVKLERSRLAKLMGLPVDALIQVTEDLGEETPRVNVEDAVASALAQRPDLVAVRENSKGARNAAFASKAARLPSVYTSLQYSWSDNSFPETWLDHKTNYAWDIRLGVSLPIFDGLMTSANIKQATARAAVADNQLREAELQVALEVKEAILILEEAAERISVSKNGLASAEEDYRLSRERYDLGSGTMLELLDAQVSLSWARSAYVDALAGLREAEALFEKATGEPLG
jgi:outer membrane protein